MPDLFQPLTLLRGPAMKNRFMLAPLTTRQSLPDGAASDYDIEWMARVARGGYALVQTCAATVQPSGKTFLGQLGIHDDAHLEGLARIATAIRQGGALSAVQIHHGGGRVDPELGGIPMPPSDDAATGARGMTLAEIEGMRESFLVAAVRAERAGFDGVVLHGAFAFVLSQFLSPALNRRTDRYGGNLENRSRLIFEIIGDIRQTLRPDFQLGLRLSVERFGLRVEELRDVAAEVMRQGEIDYLDLALWDSVGTVHDGPEAGRRMLQLFTGLPRGGVRLGTAGKIMTARRAAELLGEGCDFVLIGRAAILHADFPARAARNPDYAPPPLPVTEAFLRAQGVSPPLLDYMVSTWPNFVEP